MTKPETYKGADAVKVKCLREYTVKGGSGAGAPPDVTYEEGKTYSMSPLSAAHMTRKTYRVFAEPKGDQARGQYIGDAPFFVDVKADAEQAEAEQDAGDKAKAAKADK